MQREENTGDGASLPGDFHALLLERPDKMDIFVLDFSKEPQGFGLEKSLNNIREVSSGGGGRRS